MKNLPFTYAEGKKGQNHPKKKKHPEKRKCRSLLDENTSAIQSEKGW